MAKEKKKKHWLSNLILLICLFAAVFAGYQIYQILNEYHVGTKEYDGLAKAATKLGLDTKDKDKDDTVDYSALFAYMKKENPDYVGWLFVNDIISYPVVQAADNDYYLRRTFYGKSNRAGTLFLDAGISGWDAENVLVYGHNLMNQKMFGTLDNYKEESYYKENSYFYVYLENEVRVYQIFSAYKTIPETITYQIGFADEENHQEFIDAIINKSLYQTGVKVSTKDNIVTLSTCTNIDNGRFVVHGVLDHITKK